VVLSGLTTTGKVALLAVAGTFIVFSLVVAMLVPRRRPEFPGRRVGTFVTVAIALFAVQLGTVFWVAETQEVEAAEHAEGETEPVETLPTETETAPTETETAPTETEGAGGDAAAGKEVFASAGCGTCHTLADAGTSGAVGPNLDEARPSFDKVVERVTNGSGAMPPFKDRLTEQQIRDVAAYVSGTTRGS
jgi:mono/diheme cytochrome c family protein